MRITRAPELAHWTSEIRVDQLAAILKEAKEWHTKFEVKHGWDGHWEQWYASFIKYRLLGYEADLSAGWATIDNLNGSAL